MDTVEDEDDDDGKVDDDADDSLSRFSLMYSYANRYPMPPGMAAIILGAMPLKKPRTPSSLAISLAIAHQPFWSCSACFWFTLSRSCRRTRTMSKGDETTSDIIAAFNADNLYIVRNKEKQHEVLIQADFKARKNLNIGSGKVALVPYPTMTILF